MHPHVKCTLFHSTVGIGSCNDKPVHVSDDNTRGRKYKKEIQALDWISHDILNLVHIVVCIPDTY